MDIQSLVDLTAGKATSPFMKTGVEDTNGVQSQDDGGTTATPTSSAGEEFSTFLTLLTAQIRNQDPLAPLDSTQFVEQLATFSQLELQAKGNAVLEDIALMLAQNLYTTTENTNTAGAAETS